jgi:hypothetical protein
VESGDDLVTVAGERKVVDAGKPVAFTRTVRAIRATEPPTTVRPGGRRPGGAGLLRAGDHRIKQRT